jgi:hypothetical protein
VWLPAAGRRAAWRGGPPPRAHGARGVACEDTHVVSFGEQPGGEHRADEAADARNEDAHVRAMMTGVS